MHTTCASLKDMLECFLDTCFQLTLTRRALFPAFTLYILRFCISRWDVPASIVVSDTVDPCKLNTFTFME